jgi:hypothetical protein
MEKVSAKSRLFEHVAEKELLGYRVSAECWSMCAKQTRIRCLRWHLPGEAAEALLELATGGSPKLRSLPSSRAC